MAANSVAASTRDMNLAPESFGGKTTAHSEAADGRPGNPSMLVRFFSAR
jgi:hypothetical protein